MIVNAINNKRYKPSFNAIALNKKCLPVFIEDPALRKEILWDILAAGLKNDTVRFLRLRKNQFFSAFSS